MSRRCGGIEELQGFGGFARIWHVIQSRPAPAGAPDPIALRANPATVPGIAIQSTSEPVKKFFYILDGIYIYASLLVKIFIYSCLDSFLYSLAGLFFLLFVEFVFYIYGKEMVWRGGKDL